MTPSPAPVVILDALHAGASPWEAALVLHSTGAVAMGLADFAAGLVERLSGDHDAPSGPDEAGDPFGDGGTDEFGGGEFGEDGFDDGGFDDDAFGGMDDWDGGDDLGGLDGGGADLEPRLDELENEVANLSSTVSTVRSENQAINESVEEIEDNIRQLLDIYEMVTRGVNPFVDEVSGGGMEGGFGLFDDTDETEEFDDIDPAVAEAEAESFFDDEFVGDEGHEDTFEGADLDEGAEPFAGGSGASEEELLSADEAAESPTPSDGPESSEGEDAGGKTFEELKSEYESGDDRTDEGDRMDEGSPADGAPAETDASGGGSEGESAVAEDTSGDAGPPKTDPPQSDGSAARDTSTADDAGSDDSGAKPYLERLPEGYATELLVVEWLSYLRSRSSTAEALRALRYYETIDWVGADAAAVLQEYLAGLADGPPDASPRDGTQLTIDHHTHSLRYISRLSGADVQVERLDWPSPQRGDTRIERGEQRGIQR